MMNRYIDILQYEAETARMKDFLTAGTIVLLVVLIIIGVLCCAKMDVN